MKVLFAGPSIYGAQFELDGIELRPPAAHGDLAKAVVDGACAIGLVDGNFEAIAAVWHKEILFALQEGVVVAGAASMGALRAAECARFGMIPVGKIANDYLSGELDDDAAVAVLHGPYELGCPPITDALVDIEATISSMEKSGCINAEQVNAMRGNARRIFFKQRNINAIVAGLCGADHLKALYKAHFINKKRIDALELIGFLKQLPCKRTNFIDSWTLEIPPTWTTALSQITSNTINQP